MQEQAGRVLLEQAFNKFSSGDYAAAKEYFPSDSGHSCNLMRTTGRFNSTAILLSLNWATLRPIKPSLRK